MAAKKTTKGDVKAAAAPAAVADDSDELVVNDDAVYLHKVGKGHHVARDIGEGLIAVYPVQIISAKQFAADYEEAPLV